MMKYQGRRTGPYSLNGTLPHRKPVGRWRHALRHTGIVWALAFGLSWLAGLGVIKLLHIVVQLFRSADIAP
jgi:hypothetical protein